MSNFLKNLSELFLSEDRISRVLRVKVDNETYYYLKDIKLYADSYISLAFLSGIDKARRIVSININKIESFLWEEDWPDF